MDVTIKMSDATRWRPTKAGLELVGERLGPVYRDLDLGGGAPLPPVGRGPHMEMTEWSSDAGPVPRPALSGLPAGMSLGSDGLVISEPAASWEGSSRFIPFEDVDLYPTPGDFGAANGSLMARIVTPIDLPDPTNSALVGVYDEVTEEYLGLGWIGTAETGAGAVLGFALQLSTRGAPDPLRVFRAVSFPAPGDAGRWLAVRWRVGSPGNIYVEGEHWPMASPFEVRALSNISGGVGYANIAYDRWLTFIQSPNLRLGIILRVNSIRSTGTDALPARVDRVRLAL